MEKKDFIRDESLEVIIDDLIQTETELIYLKAGKVQMGYRCNVHDYSIQPDYKLV